MGGIVSSIVTSLACCVSQQACALCCRACPSCRNSTSARIGYAALFITGCAVAWIMTAHGVSSKMADVSLYADGFKNDPCLHTTPPTCSLAEMVAITSVDRVCLAMSLFFAFMCVLMFGVKSSSDVRAGFQNGLWALKLLLLGGVMTGVFFMSNSSFHGFQIAGTVGAFIFILIQLVLLVDFAHSWAERWVSNWEETNSRSWFVALLTCMIIFFVSAIILIVLMFVYYTYDGTCKLNKFFISLQLSLCVLASICAILPRVQEVNPRSGLLQSSVVSLYTSYLVWSALASSPDSFCKPGHGDAHTSTAETVSQVLGTIFAFLSVAYTGLRAGGRGKDDGPGAGAGASASGELTSSASPSSGPGASKSMEEGHAGQHVYDDEGERVRYNYSLFHLIFFLASMYMMEVITNWTTIDPVDGVVDSLKIGQSNASVWVKIVSSWVCHLLYLWTLFAPICFPNRDFSI